MFVLGIKTSFYTVELEKMLWPHTCEASGRSCLPPLINISLVQYIASHVV